MTTLAENQIHLIKYYKSNQDETILEQFCRFLLLFSIRDRGKQPYLPSFFTYDEIAHYLDSHPVTIAKLINTLKGEGLVGKQGRQIQLTNEEGLQKYIFKEPSSNMIG